MRDKIVQLAYENVDKNEWWNQNHHLVQYGIIISPDGDRRAVLIFDNKFNAYAFYINRYGSPSSFEGSIYNWDGSTYGQRDEITNWIRVNM